MKAKKYIVGMESDVTAISLVEMPAIEENYIALAKQKPQQILLEKEEKRIVCGAVLIPNRPIYRWTPDLGDFYLEFTSEVIEKLAFDYMKKNNNSSVTLDHETNASNVYLVESWIKTTENDKSNDLGFNLPVGTWFASMRVDDEETWQRVKNEELNGFSIESFVSLEELNLSKVDRNMEDNKSLLEQIKQIVLEALGKNETVEETVENTVVEEQVVEDTVVEETVESVEVSEEVVAEEETETVEEEVVETPTDEVVEETVEEVVEEAVALESVVAELNAQIETLNDEIEELKKENAKLSKQPSVKPIKANMSEDHRSPFDRMMAVMQANRK